MEKERSCLNNKEVSWRQASAISTAHDKTVTKVDNAMILSEPCDILPEKVISDITKQSQTDEIEKGQAVQSRAQKLKEVKPFRS